MPNSSEQILNSGIKENPTEVKLEQGKPLVLFNLAPETSYSGLPENYFQPPLVDFNSAIKKWHVSDDRGFSGPYSDSEILEQLKTEVLSKDSQLWSVEHRQWTRLEKLPMFEMNLISNDGQNLKKDKEKLATKFDLIQNARQAGLDFSWNSSDSFWKEIESRRVYASLDLSGQLDGQSHFLGDEKNEISRPKKEGSANLSHWQNYGGLLLGIGISLIVFAMVRYNSTKGNPELAGLTRQEQRELAAAIAESPQLGPSAAIGVIQKMGMGPLLVISSNQKDDTLLEVSVEGNPETLIGVFKYLLGSTLKIKNGVGTFPLQEIQGDKKIPTGDYKISILCATCEDVHRHTVLAQKNIFIGGDKDMAYELGLRKYHDQLRGRARDELLEARQFMETLEQQTSDLVRISLKNDESARKNWLDLDGQLFNLVERWNTLNAHGEVFYSGVFSKIHAIQKKLQDLQSARPPNDDFALRTKSIQGELAELRANIEKVSRAPLSANGMPQF
jgi:hypothetical protein